MLLPQISFLSAFSKQLTSSTRSRHDVKMQDKLENKICKCEKLQWTHWKWLCSAKCSQRMCCFISSLHTHNSDYRLSHSSFSLVHIISISITPKYWYISIMQTHPWRFGITLSTFIFDHLLFSYWYKSLTYPMVLCIYFSMAAHTLISFACWHAVSNWMSKG